MSGQIDRDHALSREGVETVFPEISVACPAVDQDDRTFAF
jgi:hypothetical protein